MKLNTAGRYSALVYQNHQWLSDSIIFSADQVPSEDILEHLLFGQLVFEGQWLMSGFPTLIILAQEESLLKDSTAIRLYNNVYLLPKSIWPIIDHADNFLINNQFYDICRSESGIPGLDISTAEDFTALADTRAFLIGAVDISHDQKALSE